jgi:hypothetical protein
MVQANRKKIMTNQKTLNVFFGILAGFVAYMVIGSLGLYLLKISWADYAISSKDKSYTFAMLLSRLFIGIFASIAAGVSATKIANDKGKSAWFAGVIVFCVAAYIHFVRVWTDYPVWYHFAYLLPIIPIIGISHYFFANGNRLNSDTDL